MLRRWERSGRSARAFAAEAGVSAWALYQWRRQEKREADGGRGTEFVRLDITGTEAGATPGDATETPSAVVVLPSGIRIEFLNGGAATLEATIVRLLERC
jgi:transposase-like protein